MSDQVKVEGQDVKVDGKQVDESQIDKKLETKDEDLIKSLEKAKDAKLESIKEFYDKEFEKLKKELAGVNRSNSELQKKVKTYETEKLTETEKLELEKKTLNEEYQRIWRLKAINKAGWIDEEELNFEDYLFGDNEEEVMKKTENLKLWLDNKIKVGIKKGVDEQIAKGYVPKTGLSVEGKPNFENMTPDELGKAYKDAQTKEEKDVIWKEQLRRQGIK